VAVTGVETRYVQPRPSAVPEAATSPE
jgi:hypothetical protein